MLNNFLINDNIFKYIKEHNKVEFQKLNLIDITQLSTIKYYESYNKEPIDINIYDKKIPKNGFIDEDTFDNLKNNNYKDYEDYKNYKDYTDYLTNFNLLYNTSYIFGYFIDYNIFITNNNKKITKNFNENKKNLIILFKNSFEKLKNTKNIITIIENIELNENINISIINFIKNIKDIFNEYKDNINEFYYIKLINKVLKNENIDEIIYNKIFILLRDFNLNIKLIQFFKILENNNYKLLINDNNYMLIISYYIKIIYCSIQISNQQSVMGKINNYKCFKFNLFSSVLGLFLISSVLLNDYINESFYTNKINENLKIIIYYGKSIENLKNNCNNRLDNIIYKNNNKYNLMNIDLKIIKKNKKKNISSNVINGFICNNKYYIYDSNNDLLEFDWGYNIDKFKLSFNLYKKLHDLIILYEGINNDDKINDINNNILNIIKNNLINIDYIKNNLINFFVFNDINYIKDIIENIDKDTKLLVPHNFYYNIQYIINNFNYDNYNYNELYFILESYFIYINNFNDNIKLNKINKIMKINLMILYSNNIFNIIKYNMKEITEFNNEIKKNNDLYNSINDINNINGMFNLFIEKFNTSNNKIAIIACILYYIIKNLYKIDKIVNIRKEIIGNINPIINIIIQDDYIDINHIKEIIIKKFDYFNINYNIDINNFNFINNIIINNSDFFNKIDNDNSDFIEKIDINNYKNLLQISYYLLFIVNKGINVQNDFIIDEFKFLNILTNEINNFNHIYNIDNSKELININIQNINKIININHDLYDFNYIKEEFLDKNNDVEIDINYIIYNK